MAAEPTTGNTGRTKDQGKEPRGDLKGKITYPQEFHREFPQAPDAEKGVLSSILLAPREVFDTKIKAHPPQHVPDTHFRVRHDKVDKSGVVNGPNCP